MPPKLKKVGAEVLRKNNDSAATIEEVTDSRQHEFTNFGAPTEQQKKIDNYLSTLSELERRVCEIARDHLKSSFDLSRSSGFVAWNGTK